MKTKNIKTNNTEKSRKPRKPGREQLSGGQGSNSKSIRSHNEKTVLHLLRYLKTASRMDLAHHTSLTSQSLAMITGSLEKKRLIVNVGRQINGIGQPSLIYRLNSKGVYSIGFNVGRKNLDMMLIDFAGNVCERNAIEYPFPVVETVIEAIESFINFCIQSHDGIADDNLAGVGIGMPNFLGSWTREFDDNNKVKAWDQKKFQDLLNEKIEHPLYFEKDMNAATMAAMIKGSGNSLKNFIYLYLGTFIGGGVVLNQKLVKGESGNAGNFGTTLVSLLLTSLIYDPTTPNPGQLLSYVSINRLKKYLADKGVSIPKNNKDFFTLIESKSPEVEGWLQVWLEEISLLLAQAILISNSVLDLEHVIFDSSLHQPIVKKICQLINKNFFRFDTTGLMIPQVIPGNLGMDARALGSAMIPIYEQYVPNHFSIGKVGKTGENGEAGRTENSQLVRV